MTFFEHVDRAGDHVIFEPYTDGGACVRLRLDNRRTTGVLMSAADLRVLRDAIDERLGDKAKPSGTVRAIAEPLSRGMFMTLPPEPTLDEQADRIPFGVAARIIERAKEATA